MKPLKLFITFTLFVLFLLYPSPKAKILATPQPINLHCFLGEKTGKFGLVDEKGNIIVKPQYDSIGPFSEEGYAAVSKNGKFGFIDANGKVIIKLQYDGAGNFSNGLARVHKKYSDETVHFIDKHGKIKFSIKGSCNADFTEGLVPIMIDGYYGYINTEGNLAIPPKYDFACSFHDGLALVYSNNKNGFINRHGKNIIKMVSTQKIRYSDFSDGRAIVLKVGENNYKYRYGFIDTTGRYIVRPEYLDLTDFHDGIAAFYAHSNLKHSRKAHAKQTCYSRGLIDKNGHIIYETKNLKYQYYYFNDGVAVIHTQNGYGKCGLISQTGKIILKPKYDIIWDFENGLAVVTHNKKKFLIDPSGKKVANIQE